MKTVEIWDLPTRLFKWALVMLVALSWGTGGEAGASFIVHVVSGYLIALLILFRTVWGFVGGEHARFAGFLRGPGAVLRHLGSLFGGKGEPHPGHTPAGGWMILLLLGWVGAIVVTGLLSRGEGYAGPLWPHLGGEGLAELHETLVDILPIIVGVHIVGVLLGGAAAKQSLILAMVSGRKEAAELPPGTADAKPAAPMAALIALTLVAALGAMALLATDFAGLNAEASPEPLEDEGGERD